MVAFDPYTTLGVSHSASQDEIKSAYRKMAKKYHPDLNPGDKTAETKFKNINKANEFIGDPQSRAKFDRGETDEQQQEFWQKASQRGQQFGGQGYGGFNGAFEGLDPEFFEAVFGASRGASGGASGGTTGRSRAGRRAKSRTQQYSQLYSMSVDFTTAILGGEREITLPSHKKLRVKIPPGIHSGTKLRLAGQGESEDDVYIQVEVQPHAHFRRVGNDIEIDLPVSITEAILGKEVKVPTLEGAVMLKIPAGVSTDQKLRVRGKGVPQGKTKGDQIVVIKIALPSQIDPQLQNFMESWGKDHPYNPRST